MSTEANQEQTTQDEQWDWWNHVTAEDYAYCRTAPRQYREPCLWCGLRTTHTLACELQRDLLAMEMPFGKHKGKPVRRVPRDYLRWLRQQALSGELSVKAELLEEIEQRLRPQRA
jgi:uncharacterized protein (DUF3820 family)